MAHLDDLFISDEEVEFCPLCVEEMDISDKNFKPCPCGYQICQFCYNNIRQNPELNGRCPGCRRLYDDESVEYRTLTAEEYKMQQSRREKREREKKQKEKEKKELELASKKHLAGLRVVQKNLVYVTGLNPPCPQEDLHSVLRSDKYFGQYGKILKIVINRKSPAGHLHVPSNMGIVVYVTFSKKEDALRCINELDGSLCDGRILRAAHGTTKYCLSYLRGHPCPNPNCMFLHEPGEEADSYTRKDLSTHQGIKMGMSGHEGSSDHLNEHYSDDERHSDDERAPSSLSNAVPVALLSQTVQISTPTIHREAPVLPPTAHWAKLVVSEPVPSLSSPAAANVANAAAFPTLGEIFKDQKVQKKDSKKSKSKASKELVQALDDQEIDENTTLHFAEDCADKLAALIESKQKLKVHFEKIDENAKDLTLFSFKLVDDFSLPTDGNKSLAIHVIETFLLKPMKKYHLAYLNQTTSQLQQLLQQQGQQIQQTPQTQQTQQTQQNQQSQQHQKIAGQDDQTSLQQRMLLMQFQKHQAQMAPEMAGQMNLNPIMAPLASQVHGLRMSERSRTSTPPPPGLFGKGQERPPPQQANQAAQSSSSQLLTQLMNGKR